MKWGVFEPDSDVIHVAPIDVGDDQTSHELSERCRCHPAWDLQGAYQGTRPLLIHEHIQ